MIKVATGAGCVTAYEDTVLRAAADARRATGAPITTHTEAGTMGVEQLAILVEEPTHVFRRILPRLREAGVGDGAIRAMLVDNPRRYFSGAVVSA